MARIFDLRSLSDWSGLAENEVRVIPLVQYPDGMRVRLVVSRRGRWPAHAEERAELYAVLAGEVVYATDHEQCVSAGQAILLAPGEMHGARVENGAVSLNVDWAGGPAVSGRSGAAGSARGGSARRTSGGSAGRGRGSPR